MRRYAACWITSLMCCLPWVAWSQAPPNAPEKPDEVQTANGLISLLGHERFSERLKAMAGLERLGHVVLPRLQEWLDKPLDPEVRRRLEDIITKLESDGALKPTRLTLQIKEQKIREILETLSKQSGYKIELWPQNNNDEREKRLYSFDFNDVTFWEAVQKICEHAGLTYQEGWYGNEVTTIRLMLGESFPGYYSLDGPFRIVVRGFNYSRNLDLSGNQGQGRGPIFAEGRSENLNMNLTVSVEPKMPLYSAGMPNITEAIDDQGQDLKPTTVMSNMASRQQYYYGYRGYMQNVNVTLNPSAQGRRLKSLKGTVPVTVIALQRPKIVVNNLSEIKNQTFKAGTTTLIIEEVIKNGDQVTIKLNLSETANRGGNNANVDYSWVNTVMQRIEVQDDKGNKLQSISTNWGMNNNNVQGTFTYRPLTAGNNNNNKSTVSRLIYYDWITMSHNVPFVFQDLPLP